MNSYKKLVSNSMIFAVGTFGSKLVSLLLVPLYTYYLSTGEYGTVDLMVATINMLLPIVSLSVFEAVLRFTLDDEVDQQKVLSNSVLIVFGGFVILLLFYPVLSYFGMLGNMLNFLYIILLLQMIERILSQHLRGSGKVKEFALNGIILATGTGLFNILFLVGLGFGIEGYFYAMIVAHIISLIYLFYTTNALSYISFKDVDKETLKNIIGYSAPLVPNSIMWWLINASSRYFITFFVSLSANGLYAVASKIPSLLNVLYQVFNQAWQLSAIEEYDNDNRPDFYSKVFNYLSAFMFIGGSVIIILVKPMFTILFAPEYFNGWAVTPFLVLGTIFSSFSSFLGTNYIAAKQTRGIFNTSIYGGVISVVFNLILIPTLGVIGASISSVVSFVAMFVLRYWDTREYVELHLNIPRMLTNVAIIALQILIMFINLPIAIELTINGLLLIGLIVFNGKMILSILGFIVRLIKK